MILVLFALLLYLYSNIHALKSVRTHKLQFRDHFVKRYGDKLGLAFKKPQAHNAPGNMYVDESCVDCDVCRWMCPSVFGRRGIKSVVQRQPVGESDTLAACAAIVACPVGAIRLRQPDPAVKAALDLFPVEIDPVRLPGVFHAGYHSAASFGATPYFVKRSAGGNLMIDCPRFNSR